MTIKRLLRTLNLLTLAILFGSVLSLVGCGDRAEELYETAQFEELQNNKAHARKLYEQIVREHANSPYATRAKERMAAMATGSE